MPATATEGPAGVIAKGNDHAGAWCVR